MNYEQALKASKYNPVRVNKVLERLDVECPECNGSQEFVHFTVGEHRVAGTCKYCKEGKISYTWTPQVGEWFLSKFGGLCLIYEVGDHFLRIAGPECKAEATGMSDGFIPILEWQVIEEVLEKAGYEVNVSYDSKEGGFCTIWKGDKYITAQGKNCLIAVYKAALALGKELK